MNTRRFVLLLSGIAELSPKLANSLYSATRGQIELNMCDGVVFLEFKRQSKSLREAVLRAIEEVEGAALGVRVVRVESETANVIAKINADLLGVATGG